MALTHDTEAQERLTPEQVVQRDREFATMAALAVRPDDSLAAGLRAIRKACDANLRTLRGRG